MFDFDNHTNDHAVITFSYKLYDDEGRAVSSVTRTIRNDDAEYLPSILSAFVYFLQGMTFTYVENVVAVSDKGTEYSSEDVL